MEVTERHAPICHQSLSHPRQGRSLDTTLQMALRAICQVVGGSARARSAAGRTLWRTGDCLLPHRGAGPTQGRDHNERPICSNHSSLQVKQELGDQIPLLRATTKPSNPHTRTHMHTWARSHKHYDQPMGTPGRKTGPGTQTPSSLKGQRSATALMSQDWLCALS